MHSSSAAVAAPLSMLRLWMILCMFLNAVQQPIAVKATDDVANVSPCELESILNQLVNPNPEYQLHASALRNQLKNILRDRQLAIGEQQSLNDYDYLDEDKRSVAALAAQGLLHPGNKRSLATLAKNGQLPTPDPEDSDAQISVNGQKRYVGALARSGGFMGYGKRNVGSLARDYQLPQNGKRNLATLARLGLLTKNDTPKRNVAAVARYNSARRGAASAEKRNLGALKGSPVHGSVQQKREDEEVFYPAAALSGGGGGEMDYADFVPNYWMYPSYADMDWGDFGRAQKRFLDTSKDPELFGIENAIVEPPDDENLSQIFEPQQKRHIGAVYRSGFLPSYRALRSSTGNGYGGGGGGGGGRFSRSGRARQFVEYYPLRERLRQPIAAVCKRCFLPYRPVVNWGAHAGIRGRMWPPTYISAADDASSILANSLPTSSGRRPVAYASTITNTNTNSVNHHHSPASFSSSTSWGTPPRITALHRRSFRRNEHPEIENYEY